VPEVLDLDAYLERLGLSGRPGLAEVHLAHACSIPFENLDPHRGVPVSLDEDALERKLVSGRRGGYCFEQNVLLKAALEQLGARVEMMLARVRAGAPPGTIRPRTHLVLRVDVEGAIWHADVGFGVGTLLEPIPFGAGGVFEQAGWPYRVVEAGRELVLQTADGTDWRDLYAFVPEPVPLIDVELSNWYTATYPRSPFVTGLMVTTHRADGTRVSLTDWTELALTVQTPSETSVTPVTRADVPRLLQEQFELSGFSLDAAGRLQLGGSCAGG
jgi:N-hydroxyarylamine O-acetyltransferase